MNAVQLREKGIMGSERMAVDAKEAADYLLSSFELGLSNGVIPADDHRTSVIKEKIANINRIVDNMVMQFENKKIELIVEGDFVTAYTEAKSILLIVCDFMQEGLSPNDSAEKGPVSLMTDWIRHLRTHLSCSAGLLLGIELK